MVNEVLGVTYIDLGIVKYSSTPKTFSVNLPSNYKQVEIGVYGKGSSQVNKYGGWKGNLSVNGVTAWKSLGLVNKTAMVQDYVLKQKVAESTVKNQYMNITGLVRKGTNKITYSHFTSGDGIGVKLKIVSPMKTLNNITILSVKQTVSETVITGQLTANGKTVSGKIIGVEDPIKNSSQLGVMTDRNGKFEYKTWAPTKSNETNLFLFFYEGVQQPYALTTAFNQYKLTVQSLAGNDAYEALSAERKANISKLQDMQNNISDPSDLSSSAMRQAKQDVIDVAMEDILAQKLKTGMEVVDWAGSVGLCGEGLLASGATAGTSAVACGPLVAKLSNEGVQWSADILVKNNILSGTEAAFVKDTSNAAVACISVEDPMSSATCIGTIASGGLRVVGTHFRNNDYGVPVLILDLAEGAADTIDVVLMIIGD